MSRQMPGLQAEFHRQVADAMKLAEIGEIARAEATAASQTRRELHYRRIELLYELAFLRMFVAWEAFLEQVFLRYLCGYTSKHGGATPRPGQAFSPTLAATAVAVLGGKNYLLWHNPLTVADRCAGVFASCPIETVLRSNAARLDACAAVRHRIAHAQTDARQKFDAATMTMAGQRYRGARPGAFLRDRDATTTPRVRWVDVLGQELQGLAAQIA